MAGGQERKELMGKLRIMAGVVRTKKKTTGADEKWNRMIGERERSQWFSGTRL